MSTKKKFVEGAKPQKDEPAKQELAKEQATAVAQVVDYGDDVGAGFENTTNDDMSIPFIQVLQSNSPQLKDVGDGGLEGAKQGQLHNTVTNQLYNGKEGLVLVPATTEHVHVEWKPRESGGGFVGIHDSTSPVVQGKGKTFGKFKMENGNDLIETFYIYGVLLDGESVVGPAVIPFSSTKIKAYKDLMTRLNTVQIITPSGRRNPPLFAHPLRMTTFADKNTKGDFYNVRLNSAAGNFVEGLLAPSHPAFAAAKQLREMVNGGTVKAQPQASHTEESDTNGGGVHF